MHAVDEIEIRERYWGLIRKVKSLKVAVDERRNRIYTLQDIDGTRNLKSARVRAPKYITALQNMLERDIHTLKQEYEHGKSLKMYQKKHVTQIDNLLGDLESRFESVVHSMYVPAGSVPIKHSTLGMSGAIRYTDDHGSQSTYSMDMKEDIATNLTIKDSPAASPTKVTDVESIFSSPNSLFPDIKLPSVSGNVSPRSIEQSDTSMLSPTNQRQEKHTVSAPVAHVTNDPTLARPEGMARGYTSLTKNTGRVGRVHLEPNTRRPSMVGYPFASSFPALPPLPVRRQKTIMDKQSSQTKTDTDVNQVRPKLRRNNTIFVNRNLRERTWFY